jgi:uncharacterized membrane protein YtjA (UPF0391 family)
MLSWAVGFFVLALVAALFGWTGLAGAANTIAWAIVAIALVLAVVFAVTGRRPRK